MTNQNNAAQAANDNPLSDEYVNAIIQRHGYDSPESVIAQLHQWIGLHGGENGVTLLMYEAHKALSKLRAPVADERCKRCGGPGWYTSHTTGYPESIPCSACNPQGVSLERLATDPFLAAQLWRKPVADGSALASAPVAGERHGDSRVGLEAPVAVEARPVAWRYQTPTGWHATTDAQKAVRLRAHHPVEPLYPEPQASAEDFDFVAHLARQAEFSARTFGPGARVAGVCDHIRKELIEVETSGGDVKEWVDVIILGLDGAWRSGATPQEIIAAIVAKQAKNEARTWPDWRTVDPNKAIEHQRTAAPCTCPSGDGSLRHPCAEPPQVKTCKKEK